MRAIFLVLLIANLAFFVHQAFIEKTNKSVMVTQESSNVIETKENLQLLSESSIGTFPDRKTEQHLESIAEKKAVEELCTMLGPYEQLLQAEYATERLAALGVEAHITPVEIQEGESYWVYLKPEMSEKEAVRRLYELQKKNIESYVITKGELTNGISFGRFADYADAEAKLNEVKNQGYEAALKRLPKTIQETWVVINAGLAEKVDETVWVDLLSKQIALEKRQNYCLGVASQ